MSRFAHWLLLSSLLLTAAPALAAPKKPLQVLIIQSEDSVDQAKALTLALRQAVAKSKSFTLAQGDYSLEVMTLALACNDPPDDVCLTRISAKVKSDQFLWGSMKRENHKVVAFLHLWRKSKPQRSVAARYSDALTDADDDALAGLARTLVSRLSNAPPPNDGPAPTHIAAFPAPAGPAPAPATKPAAETNAAEPQSIAEEPEPEGELVVEAGEVTGQLIIDGRARGVVKHGYAKLKVTEGPHEVSVRAEGFHEASGDVTVKANARTRITLEPKLRNEPKTGQASSSAAQADSGTSTAGWAAIGAGGVLVAGGVFSAMRVSSINNDAEYESYRKGFPSNQNACAEAQRGVVVEGATSPARMRDLCSQARTFEALEYLLFGVGAVAIGTGALIILTDSSSDGAKDKQALVLTPRATISPQSAGLDLSLKF